VDAVGDLGHRSGRTEGLGGRRLAAANSGVVRLMTLSFICIASGARSWGARRCTPLWKAASGPTATPPIQ